MIETFCACEKAITAPESAVGSSVTCGKCGQRISFISAEKIEPGSAIGDFDARLVITQGPVGVGRVLALGGVPDLEIGKSPDRHIPLPGTMVSRAHAKLSRLDFGPSRWKIVDTQSRNGVFVNDQQVGEVELTDGDSRAGAAAAVTGDGGGAMPGMPADFFAGHKSLHCLRHRHQNRKTAGDQPGAG
jgi:hypothetical protein